jgi:ABC-type multidrug transport system fused ATPase/permease subunit
MTVAIRGGYFVVSATVLGLIALAVSAELTLLFAVLGLPVVLVLRRLFDAQTRLSREQTGVRQTLAADLAERLNNLFQIKVEGNEVSHHRMALKRAPEVARLEVKIGTGLSFIASANGLLLLVGLVGFYLWSAWRGAPLADAFALVASVGIVGYKAAAHANNALTTIGNLARLAGSIEPVYELIFLPPESARRPVPAKVTGVVLDGVSYSFNETRILDDASFSAGVGHPVAIRGPSGSGKTTAANLIAGLLTPSQGVVWYATEDGGRFDARQYKAHVGYVPQDISLFHGSFRDNIQFTAEPRTDAELMAILQQVDADEYVRQHGGLDATLLEGGRSLSGGERRRLGIARVLAQRPDILILDEVMNGLDEQRKSEVARIVQALSRRLVIIAITHDPEEYPGWREWQSAARPVLASGA